jgi:cytochrome c biogenesis protein CcdA/thiol-disulfide isomerase/thioredoxin
VLVLLLIGLIAGIATALSPCVLPVLPILLAGGASGRKPFRIIAGLVLSFSAFTLFASWLLGKLGLPQDLLRNLAIVLLFVMAAVLLVPQAGLLVERRLAAFSRLRPAQAGGGFVLGVTLGLVFVPCAGPFLGAITTAAGREQFGGRTIAATLAYATGAAIPMLAIAIGGREASARIRSHADTVRMASGILIAFVAFGLVFHVDDHLAEVSAPWTTYLQDTIENSAGGKRELAKLRGGGEALTAARPAAGSLPDYGAAPPIHADGDWINTKPLTIEQLRGKVVLVDFWTYSCINCLRTLPHLKAWDATYRKQGLVILGVHTPEFAFEHVAPNVRAAVKRLGINYPVVQDNRFKTWDNYANQYWPAEYLIDKTGRVRHTHFGEGQYHETEQLIRRLLGARGAKSPRMPDATPTGLLTPETYLGYERLNNYAGTPVSPDIEAPYRLPDRLPQNTIAYGGEWKIDAERATAVRGSRLALHFNAKNVYIVLGGKGTVRATVDGKVVKTIPVSEQKLYTVRASARTADETVDFSFTPGVQAYSFTFG